MTSAERLDALYEARDRGVLTVKHGQKLVTYQSAEDIQRTISRLERELATTRPAVSGRIATGRGF
jgi:hypothetical protein